MTNKILVIEVDSLTTRVVEMDYVSKKPNVYNYFVMETPVDTTRDGSVRPNDDFITNFKNNYAFSNMTAKRCLFLLSSSRIISRNHVIPYVKPKQIQGVVDGMFTEFFPVDQSLFHTHYEIIDVRKEASEIELNILAIPNELTAGYFDLAKALELEVVDIKYTGKVALDLKRILSGVSIYESQLLHELPDSIVEIFDFYNKSKDKQDKKPLETATRDDGAVVLGTDEGDNATKLKAVIKLEAYSSFVTIIKGDSVVLDRSVSMGISNVLEYVMGESEFGENLTFTDALAILNKNTLVSRTFDEYVNDADPLAAHKNAITSDIEILTESISRAIEYYLGKNEGEYISNLYLAGAGAEIKGLARLLQNELGYNTEVLDSYPGLTFAKKELKNQQSEQELLDIKTAEEAAPEAEQTFSLDDLNNLKDKIAEEETKLDTDIEGENEKFNVPLFSFLITAGLSYGGIVTNEERFGDAAMAQSKKDKKTTLICILSAAVLLLLSTLLIFISVGSYNSELKKQKNLKKEIKKYEDMKVEEIYNEYNCEISKSSELMNILAYTHTDNENLTAFIKEFETKIPSDTVVLSLIANDNGITMDLQSPDKESVAKTIMILRTFECIETVSSENLTDSATYDDLSYLEDDIGRVVSYSVSLTYKKVPYDVESFLKDNTVTDDTKANGEAQK